MRKRWRRSIKLCVVTKIAMIPSYVSTGYQDKLNFKLEVTGKKTLYQQSWFAEVICSRQMKVLDQETLIIANKLSQWSSVLENYSVSLSCLKLSTGFPLYLQWTPNATMARKAPSVWLLLNLNSFIFPQQSDFLTSPWTTLVSISGLQYFLLPPPRLLSPHLTWQISSQMFQLKTHLFGKDLPNYPVQCSYHSKSFLINSFCLLPYLLPMLYHVQKSLTFFGYLLSVFPSRKSVHKIKEQI